MTTNQLIKFVLSLETQIGSPLTDLPGLTGYANGLVYTNALQ
jgi:hypothetical protein